jgi:hypothetical protein
LVQESKDAIEALLLPNVECPADLLTPARLVTGAAAHWWKQPLPWSCDWFDKTWYPRVSFFGGLPDDIPDDDRQLPEVRLGWVAPRQKERFAKLTMDTMNDPRSSNAASPALVLPFLRGSEAIRLNGMAPDGTIVVQLPGDAPRIQIRYRGKVHEVEPVANRILISLEEMGAYVVWHGLWPISPPQPVRMPRPGDSVVAAMEGIEVFADAKRVAPLV